VQFIAPNKNTGWADAKAMLILHFSAPSLGERVRVRDRFYIKKNKEL